MLRRFYWISFFLRLDRSALEVWLSIFEMNISTFLLALLVQTTVGFSFTTVNRRDFAAAMGVALITVPNLALAELDSGAKVDGIYSDPVSHGISQRHTTMIGSKGCIDRPENTLVRWVHDDKSPCAKSLCF